MKGPATFPALTPLFGNQAFTTRQVSGGTHCIVVKSSNSSTVFSRFKSLLCHFPSVNLWTSYLTSGPQLLTWKIRIIHLITWRKKIMKNENHWIWNIQDSNQPLAFLSICSTLNLSFHSREEEILMKQFHPSIKLGYSRKRKFKRRPIKQMGGKNPLEAINFSIISFIILQAFSNEGEGKWTVTSPG